MIRSNTHAFEILESPQPFIPYEAIRYLYYQTPAEDIRKKVFYWIENAYNYEVVPKESDLVIEAPIWFGIVAENYIEEALIDPVIDLYCKVNDDWDLLNEQGVVLIQKLCENLGDIAIEKFLNKILQQISVKSELPYLYLFESFQYLDPDKYPNQILSLLETRSYWMTALLGMLPNIQFSQKKHSDLLEKIYEKLSLIQLEYETMESHDHIDASILSEIKNCQKALASSDYPNNRKITFRRGEWEAHYRKFERQRMNFYNSEDSTMPTPISIPKKVSRNAPCPCGSGKKYKHCCL
jgi:Predicted metal-binding protein related to the C-terminal domain of SecA